MILVLPKIHTTEYVDITVKRVEVITTAQDKDFVTHSITTVLLVRIDTDSDATFIKTIEKFGAQQISTAEFCSIYFTEKLIEVVQRAVAEYDKRELIHRNAELKKLAIANLSEVIKGFIIDDLTITLARKE